MLQSALRFIDDVAEEGEEGEELYGEEECDEGDYYDEEDRAFINDDSPRDRGGFRHARLANEQLDREASEAEAIAARFERQAQQRPPPRPLAPPRPRPLGAGRPGTVPRPLGAGRPGTVPLPRQRAAPAPRPGSSKAATMQSIFGSTLDDLKPLPTHPRHAGRGRGGGSVLPSARGGASRPAGPGRGCGRGSGPSSSTAAAAPPEAAKPWKSGYKVKRVAGAVAPKVPSKPKPAAAGSGGSGGSGDGDRSGGSSGSSVPPTLTRSRSREHLVIDKDLAAKRQRQEARDDQAAASVARSKASMRAARAALYEDD